MAQRSGNGTRTIEEGLTLGLGWFSIGLGLTQFLAPRSLSRVIGVKSHPLLMRLLGLREIASGIAILAQRQPDWFQARVAGDVMDLAMLSPALLMGRHRGRVALVTAAVAGATALDVRCSRQLRHNGHPGAIRVRRVVTINRPAEELYRFWRNFEELPRVLNHLQSIRVTGEKTSHWVAKGPAGTSVEWDAEIINEHPNEMIAWRSVEGSGVQHAGSVRFEQAHGGRGTVVKVDLQYFPPAGALGATVAKLLGEAPEKQIQADLLRFKQLMETGKVARSEG